MRKPFEHWIIGANGLAGSAMAKGLGSAGVTWVETGFRRSLGRMQVVDVTNNENLQNLLKAINPKTIVFALRS